MREGGTGQESPGLLEGRAREAGSLRGGGMGVLSAQVVQEPCPMRRQLHPGLCVLEAPCVAGSHTAAAAGTGPQG